MAIRIPIFLLCPSLLTGPQQETYDYLCDVLAEEGLQPRALGRSDFPQSDPMTEVYYIARACYGGIILGFKQMAAEAVTLKPDTPAARDVGAVALPTPWNQVEAGILIALRRPLLVFAEDGIEGGVFDQGAFPGFLQRLRLAQSDREAVRERVRHWSAQVRTVYRS
ncbi:MAG: hypothetical protein KDJ36_15625 [Hyphomicrobiaceae bacterium]|nr:hypothetical protein [Hyphomicrobiaceae bacterium]